MHLTEGVDENSIFYSSGMFSDIVEELKKYDIMDFISRLAGMNLISQNQNKSPYFDTLLSEILHQERSAFISDIKMSSGKFSKILKQLSESTIKLSIDPNETTFVQNVMMYDRNYCVFNGIDVSPAYYLQALERILLEYKNDFPEDYLQKMAVFYRFVLKISDSVAKALGINVANSKNDEGKAIYIPDSNTILRNGRFVRLNAKSVKEFLGEDEVSGLLSGFGLPLAEEMNQIAFYSAPFLYDECLEEIIILDISLLPTFAFSHTIAYAEKYSIKEKLMSMLNDFVWSECNRYLKKLGHLKIKESELNIQLVNYDYYKERILSVNNNQLMLLMCIADDGYLYSANSRYMPYPDKRHEKILSERLGYFNTAFDMVNVADSDIFCVVIILGFGRGLQAPIVTKVSKYPTLFFLPFELECLSINEYKHNGFIPRYLRAKSKLMSFSNITMISELNPIEYYIGNGYSFYASDDIDMSTVNAMFGPGDSYEFVKRAVETENRKRVMSYDKSPFTEVVSSELKANILHAVIDYGSRELATAVQFSHSIIWFFSDAKDGERLNIAYSIIDLLSFWFSEMAECIEWLWLPEPVYSFKVVINGDSTEYYYAISEERSFEELIDVIKEDDCHYSICFCPEVFHKLICEDNSAERLLVECIIGIIAEISNDTQMWNESINKVFTPNLKKKMFSLDFNQHPYLRPFPDSSEAIRISSEDEDDLCDYIGREIIRKKSLEYGVVESKKRSEIANEVVTILYNMLREKVGQLNPIGLLEMAYYDLEKVLYYLMMANERYASDVSCYPNQKSDILAKYNDYNKSSLALKFFIEYISAQPPKGKRLAGIGDYEYILAICSMIIDWAYKNDLFYYKIFETPVEILKSNRIGLKRDEFDKITEFSSLYRQTQLTYSFNGQRKSQEGYLEELDEAFYSERGYSYSEFINVVFSLIEYGKEIGGEIFVKGKTDVIYKVSEFSSKSNELVEKVLRDISLSAREDFLIPPSGFTNIDIYPWRFNRQYSFIRRPVIERNNEYIWGNRQVYNMAQYVSHLIFSGLYSSKDVKVKALIGKISNRRGREYNDHIVQLIRGLGIFEVYPNLKKINGKRIAEQSGKDLGDIDVLIIDKEKQKILVGEVKDFSFSRNPYEINAEYNKMFVDTAKSPCYVTKHNRRVAWVRDNIEDVCKEFSLEEKNWKILGIFIVKNPIISNEMYSKKISVLSEPEIDIDHLRNI